MKRLVLMILACGLLATSSARAGYWELHIYSDAVLTDSTISDNSPRIVNFYVVEKGYFRGATGVRFSTEPTAGFTGVWLGDETSYYKVGNSPTDIAVAYAACIPPPILVITMTYQLYGTSTPCSELLIAPPACCTGVVAPDVDCSFTEGQITDLRSLRINCAVPVEPTTWGKVKALYRD
ncbi:MAG TPA: hypothetical protein VFH88_13675 [Candidatus Krumholzibacteria bacterium]|nr:hypothetical protein [Candidatus Krumholzibacteria bacterium]